MLRLRNKSFKIISKNLKEKARPIDRERFNNHFNDAQPEKIIEEIKKYQNEIHCYLELYEEVDSKTKSLLKESIAEGIKQLIVYDHNKWQEYLPLPLDFVPAPENERFGVSEAKIEANLDFYVELIEKSKDTLVKPPWGKSFYQTDLKEAYQEWQGNWTLKILITLDNYGRIEK